MSDKFALSAESNTVVNHMWYFILPSADFLSWVGGVHTRKNMLNISQLIKSWDIEQSWSVIVCKHAFNSKI
jgi:hypothetical protein